MGLVKVIQISDIQDYKELRCPDCGGEMSFQGYRALFPECIECGRISHIDKCHVEPED